MIFIIDLLIGFIIGLILLSFFSKLKHLVQHNVKSFFTNLFSLQKIQITNREKHSLLNSSNVSRTWMYELRDQTYDSHTFSFSMTNICLIEIQKNLLLIFQPSKEPDRKLNDDELYAKVIFEQVRIYNLNNALIGLLPINMVRSKYWSKKSPIVLQNIHHVRNEFLSTASTDLSLPSNENIIQKTLLLFARTRRSKEDWFSRFMNASQLESWRNEICYELEQNKTIHHQKQTQIVKPKKKNVTMIYNDQEHRKHLIDLLERTDRFAAPDQLPYLKSIHVRRKFLSNFKRETRKSFKKRRTSKNCERWLMEENHEKNKTKKYNSKDLQTNHDKNTNHTTNELSQSSVEIDSDQFEDNTHPLIFFLLKYLQKIPHNTIENNVENPILLLNLFAARCFLDFFDHEYYLEQLTVFLQKQLRKIKIPFVEHITITNLNLGDRLPEIKVNNSLPNNIGTLFFMTKDLFKSWIDEHGFWSHVKISYDGQLQLTLTAKLKLIRKTHLASRISYQNTSLMTPRKEIACEEVDNDEPFVQKSIPLKKSWRKRLWPPTHWFRFRRTIPKTSLSNKTNLNIVENMNKQEYYSSSHLEEVPSKISKTTIVIKLEVNNLNGILLFNIPPIPSDRLWISFLDMPEMDFSAIPHLGEYRVSFNRIKNKLEKKLRQIFRRYLVMPNMKDFIIPTITDYLSNSDFIKVISSEVNVNDQ